MYQSVHQDIVVQVTYLVYDSSLQEQKYLTSIRTERQAFENLIETKARMAVVSDQVPLTGFLSLAFRDPRPIILLGPPACLPACMSVYLPALALTHRMVSLDTGRSLSRCRQSRAGSSSRQWRVGAAPRQSRRRWTTLLTATADYCRSLLICVSSAVLSRHYYTSLEPHLNQSRCLWAITC